MKEPTAGQFVRMCNGEVGQVLRVLPPEGDLDDYRFLIQFPNRDLPGNFKLEAIESFDGVEGLEVIQIPERPKAENYLGVISWNDWICGNCSLFGVPGSLCSYNEGSGRNREASDFGCIAFKRNEVSH